MISRQREKVFRFYIPLGLFLIFLLFPFYWMFATTFKSDAELYNLNLNPFLIHTWSLANLKHLFTQTPFLRWLYNTFFVAITSTLISLSTSLLAAYGIQRIRFKGSSLMGIGIFFCYLVPPTILFIPLATMVFKLRLWDSLWALSLIYPTFLIPFCTWLLMGYFNSIPKELEECAMIDGASRLWIFWRVIIPLSLPGILSAGIFAFTLSWNEYLYALTFISTSLKKTVSVGLVTELVRGDVYHWGPLMAGALFGSVPVALVYSFFVEYYVAGMTGALKE
ncbi:MAG: carbohydrate ABC transporter permease [Deltaproteobacteria bacterium]|nr:carbohydrate ABC transporter permease [Deltaproteobacteria bacterium]RLB15780.1 MAG: carbohydrate ABC transporter permease [Deltaproteobacteria bacterium]